MQKDSTENRTKAQVATLDLLIAFTLFITLFFVVTGFSQRIAKEREDLFGDMLAKAHTIAFALSESRGEPTAWTFLNYTRPGLAREPNLLEEARVLALLSTNTTRLKQALGVEEYGFRVRLLNTSDAPALVGGWRNWGRVAYTVAGHEWYEGNDFLGYGLRSWMEANGIPFDIYNQTDSKQDFFNILTNRSLYNTIILEDTHINIGDLNATEREWFQEWVSSGGTYIHKEHGDIIRLVGANFSSDGPDTGNVTRFGANMIANASVGDVINCDDNAEVNNTNLQPEMANLVKYVVNSQQEALIASWNYGSGRVFFLCDTEGSVSGSVSHNNIRSILTLFGIRATHGDRLVNASTIAPAVTTVDVGGSTRKLEVTLWK